MSPAGRPEIGKPVNVRLPDDLLADVDTYAARFDVSRAEVIRRAVKRFLWDDEMTRMGDINTESVVAAFRVYEAYDGYADDAT